MRQYISLIILFSLILAKQAYSQVKFKSELPVVQTSGFYDIELSPEQVSVSTRNDLLDIRIFQDNKEQAFITNVSSNKIIRSLNNIALMQNSFKDSVNTVILNREQSLSQIYIALNKSDIIKYVQVRGSHDKNTWFIIKKKSRLEAVEFNDSEDIHLVEMPKNEYKYYELALTNGTKEAMEVLWVGFETKELIESEFTAVNLGDFTVKDTAKKSLIRFNNLSIVYKIDKIKLNVESDFGYRRDVNMGRYYFEINSNDLAPKNISTTISKNTIIEIFNGDNPPLKIKSIEAFQQKRYLTVYLKEGLKYTLESGKPNTPDYDLKYLQNEIPKKREILTTSNIEYIYPEIEKPRELKWFEKPIFLWGTIGIAGAFLLLLCFKMVRQLEEKRD